MESDEWAKQGAKLRYDRQTDTYYLHVSVTQEREDSSEEAESRTVLGVDRNVDGYLSVTSTGAFIGNADLLNHKRREYERRRARLQWQGTRSAHLTIQSIGDTFANWSEGFLHQASKRLVEQAVSQDCSVIVFEDLEQIRERISNASKFQQWAFRELKRQTAYKARAEGIPSSQSIRHTPVNGVVTPTVVSRTKTTATVTSLPVRSAAKSYTPTTMRHGISHTDTSRIGSSLVLDGRPITLPSSRGQ